MALCNGQLKPDNLPSHIFQITHLELKRGLVTTGPVTSATIVECQIIQQTLFCGLFGSKALVFELLVFQTAKKTLRGRIILTVSLATLTLSLSDVADIPGCHTGCRGLNDAASLL